MSQKKIIFLLGAGFSKPAGFPVLAEISQLFIEEGLSDRILNFFSGEWKWTINASTAEKENGTLPSDHLIISILLEEALKIYLNGIETKTIQYEEFLDWIADLEEVSWSTIQKRAVIKLKDMGASSSQVDFIQYKHPEDLARTIYELITDLLYTNINYTPLMASDFYKSFLDILGRKNVKMDIFTLNHDLVMEGLIDEMGWEYSSGFEIEPSNLYDDSNNKIPIYTGKFDKRISMYKLHGSVDQYRYRYINSENSSLEYDYMKTDDYHAKHVATHRINSTVLQRFNADPVPKFLASRRKSDLINEDNMYSDLFNRFSERLQEAKTLVICGVSFLSDEHVIKHIEENLENVEMIVNVNPDNNFPLEHPNYIHINPHKVNKGRNLFENTNIFGEV